MVMHCLASALDLVIFGWGGVGMSDDPPSPPTPSHPNLFPVYGPALHWPTEQQIISILVFETSVLYQ